VISRVSQPQTLSFQPNNMRYLFGNNKNKRDKGFRILQFNMFTTVQSLPDLIAEC